MLSSDHRYKDVILILCMVQVVYGKVSQKSTDKMTVISLMESDQVINIVLVSGFFFTFLEDPLTVLIS